MVRLFKSVVLRSTQSSRSDEVILNRNKEDEMEKTGASPVRAVRIFSMRMTQLQVKSARIIGKIGLNGAQAWKSGIAVLFLSLLFSCSSAEVNPEDPASLAKDAEAYIDSNRYIIALERLQELKNRHPYSSQAIEAHLRIADVYFLQENFPEAAATYEAFRDLHPKHPKVAYAMYRAALSYYNDIPGNHARDLTPAFKAQDSFNEFHRQFPSKEYTADAQETLLQAQ